MTTKILLTLALGFLFTACGKDKYTTKPQLRLNAVSTTELNPSETIVFEINVTDAEGDIQDSIWVQKVVPNCPNSGFTARYAMPSFTEIKNLDGDIQVCYGYGINLGCPPITGPFCPNRNDTATFRFWLRDKDQNTSDTIETQPIVITR